MDLTKIKNDIPKVVSEWGEKHGYNTGSLYASILLYRYGEIVERTFAVRRYAKKGLMITEVLRRATGTNSPTVVKNLYYVPVGGYIPIYEKKDRYNGYYQVVYKEDFDFWYETNNSINIHSIYLNPELLGKIEEFKYCGYTSGDIIEYLNKYRENPSVEMFGKLNLPLSAPLMKKAEKDKKFRTFLFRNAEKVHFHGSRATIYAYNHGMDIAEARKKLREQRYFLSYLTAARGQDLDVERIWDYCKTNGIYQRTYNDYLTALIELGFDLKDTKNLYPKDFNSMHDLRIAEYESLKAKIDREKRKEFYESFAKAGEKAAAYCYENNEFSLVAPKDVSDLVTEGNVLGHCVGKMGYDKKMVDGVSIIMFLRKADNIDTPFVTIEYDLRHNRLNQAHGEKNSNPPPDAMEFINEWLEKMKEIRKAEKVTV